MDTPKTDIFISYRRSDGRDTARTVQLALKSAGAGNIFFDYSSLRDGVFNEKIYSAIDECRVFILVLSPEALDRCVNSGDWVAKEIERARTAGCEIIPLSVNSNYDAWPAGLPESLCFLKNIQQTKLLTDEYFDASIARLLERIRHVKERQPVSVTAKAGGTTTVEREELMKAIELNNEAVVCVMKKDNNTALKLFEQSAELGFGQAMSNLGQVYENGRLGVTRDYGKAFDYYSKSATAGHGGGGWLGLKGMYENGYGCEKDEEWAANCLELAGEYRDKAHIDFIKGGQHGGLIAKGAVNDFNYYIINQTSRHIVRGKGREIDLSGLEPGYYFVTGFDGDGYKEGSFKK